MNEINSNSSSCVRDDLIEVVNIWFYKRENPQDYSKNKDIRNIIKTMRVASRWVERARGKGPVT